MNQTNKIETEVLYVFADGFTDVSTTKVFHDGYNSDGMAIYPVYREVSQ
jgi:hypothetical protein